MNLAHDPIEVALLNCTVSRTKISSSYGLVISCLIILILIIHIVRRVLDNQPLYYLVLPCMHSSIESTLIPWARRVLSSQPLQGF
jgi:hypothetical protein